MAYRKTNKKIVEKVILVDKLDNRWRNGKQEAHIKGLLHRAFSFSFSMTKRKYYYTKEPIKISFRGYGPIRAVATPDREKTYDAANRRLMEEMGMACSLKEQFSFIYKAKLDNDLFEHELDHVFFGKSNEPSA